MLEFFQKNKYALAHTRCILSQPKPRSFLHQVIWPY